MKERKDVGKYSGVATVFTELCVSRLPVTHEDRDNLTSKAGAGVV